MDSGLKRIRELMPTRRKAAEPDSFFYKFDASLEANPIKRNILSDYEADLSCLDDAAWAALKNEAVKRLVRIPGRAWEPLLDVLNEAKAYRHLQALGCGDIRFVARNYARKTPDLMAVLDGRTVLCEVKTIAASDDETFFTGKFSKVLTEAKAQLDGIPQADARKIIYVVLMPSCTLAEMAAFKAQLDAFLEHDPVPGVEIETCVFMAGAASTRTVLARSPT
jgi:hypothetical protein